MCTITHGRGEAVPLVFTVRWLRGGGSSFSIALHKRGGFVFVPLLVCVLVFYRGCVLSPTPPPCTSSFTHQKRCWQELVWSHFSSCFSSPLGSAAVDVRPSSPAKLSGQAFTCLNATCCFILYSCPPSLPPSRLCQECLCGELICTLILESKWKGSFSRSGYIGRDEVKGPVGSTLFSPQRLLLVLQQHFHPNSNAVTDQSVWCCDTHLLHEYH